MEVIAKSVTLGDNGAGGHPVNPHLGLALLIHSFYIHGHDRVLKPLGNQIKEDRSSKAYESCQFSNDCRGGDARTHGCSCACAGAGGAGERVGSRMDHVHHVFQYQH